jgi:uncharacterized RDD family membrane protein YckC
MLRRIAAMAYDAMLLFGLLCLATALVLPLNHGRAIASGNLPYSLYLLLCCYGYFAWQWTRGQTLGMRAWRMRLVDADGSPVGRRAAALRFGLALLSLLALGAGFLWALFDPGKLAFHDRFSRTRLVVFSPPLQAGARAG